METYLPDEDFVKCGQILLTAEANTSVRTALAICDVVHETASDKFREHTQRHPVVQMWGDHIPVLIQYALVVNQARKAVAPNQRSLWHMETTEKRLEEHLGWATSGRYNLDPPRWLGEYSFHMSQRAVLARLKPNVYGALWPEIDMSLTQYWPVS